MNWERHAFGMIRKLTRALAHDLPSVSVGQGIEPVHRMRVNSRRLHNAFTVYQAALPKKFSWYDDNIRKILKALGRARDLDVQIAYFQGRQRRARGAEKKKSLRQYIEFLKSSRQAVQPQLVKTMRRLRQQQILQKIEKDLTAQEKKGSLGKFTSKEIRRQVHKFLKKVLRYEWFVADSRRIKELHQMRIAAKDLRYTLEGLAPLYDKRLDGMIQDILELHHWLGDLHDYSVWKEQLAVFVASGEDKISWKPERTSLDKIYQQTHQQFVKAWRATCDQRVWDKLKKFSFEG